MPVSFGLNVCPKYVSHWDTVRLLLLILSFHLLLFGVEEVNAIFLVDVDFLVVDLVVLINNVAMV